jgi:hypothetical protein
MSGSDGGILAPGADPAGARPERPTTGRRGGRRGRLLDGRDQDTTDGDRTPRMAFTTSSTHSSSTTISSLSFDEIHPVFDAAVELV